MKPLVLKWSLIGDICMIYPFYENVVLTPAVFTPKWGKNNQQPMTVLVFVTPYGVMKTSKCSTCPKIGASPKKGSFLPRSRSSSSSSWSWSSSLSSWSPSSWSPSSWSSWSSWSWSSMMMILIGVRMTLFVGLFDACTTFWGLHYPDWSLIPRVGCFYPIYS